jgi:hypothetical protein
MYKSVLNGSGGGVQHPGLLHFSTYPLSDILKKTKYQKLDLFPSSGKRVGGTYSVDQPV